MRAVTDSLKALTVVLSKGAKRQHAINDAWAQKGAATVTKPQRSEVYYEILFTEFLNVSCHCHSWDLAARAELLEETRKPRKWLTWCVTRCCFLCGRCHSQRDDRPPVLTEGRHEIFRLQKPPPLPPPLFHSHLNEKLPSMLHARTHSLLPN